MQHSSPRCIWSGEGHRQSTKKQDDAEKEAATTKRQVQQGGGAAVKAPCEFKLFDVDERKEIDRVKDTMPANHEMQEPLIITNEQLSNFIKTGAKNDLDKFMKDFKDLFDDSSQKVSHGRGQKRIEKQTMIVELTSKFKAARK